MSVAELRPAAAPGAIPTAEELVARARALAPKLRERAVQAERDRNIPQESVDEFIDAGLIHTLQPKRWGGYEHDHEVAFDIAVELGKSTCGSSAWCLNYLADHACILALFPEEAQHDVWSRDKAACIATSAAPTGKVAPAPGGYRLDGRWSWCSGLRHSQWIMIGGLVQREGEDHPDMRLYLVPVSEVKQDDTWYCAGLRASGSNTSVLDNVFVPEHRSVSFSTLRDACAPGSKVNTNPIFNTPFIAVHSYALLAPVLGLARGGYADFVQWTRKRYLTYTAAQYRPARAGADARRRDRRRDRRGGAVGAARVQAGAAGLFRHVARDPHAAAPRFHLCRKKAARGDGRSGQDLRLERPDGRQSDPALLARRARHLLARGDELGRAGGEFRADGVRPRPQSGLSDVLIAGRQFHRHTP